MTELLWLLAVAIGLFIFWRLRQQEEWARLAAANLCKQQQLQLLEVALVKRRLGKGGLIHRYALDFSQSADTRYQAVFEMQGRKIVSVEWPVMRDI